MLNYCKLQRKYKKETNCFEETAALKNESNCFDFMTRKKANY